jgi:hypothetical protein
MLRCDRIWRHAVPEKGECSGGKQLRLKRVPVIHRKVSAAAASAATRQQKRWKGIRAARRATSQVDLRPHMHPRHQNFPARAKKGLL